MLSWPCVEKHIRRLSCSPDILQTAQDISFANILTLFQALASRQACCTDSQSDTAAAAPSPQTERKSVTVHGKWNQLLQAESKWSVGFNSEFFFLDLMHLNGISVAFLPLDSLSKLPEKQKYSNFFHTIYFSARFLSSTAIF